MTNLSENDVIILRSVFDKYDLDKCGSLDCHQFALLLARLGKHVKELKNIDDDTSLALCAFLDDNSHGKLSFNEFCTWWSKNAPQRYSYFTEETSKLLRKAYGLYQKYTNNGGMNYLQFEKMMGELQISYTDDDFDALDQNEDGTLSFSEFCSWLNWF